MRPHRYSDVSLSPAFAESAWRRKSTSKAPAAAKALYQQIAERSGYELIRRARSTPGALWSEKVGSPAKLMGIVGPVSDLIIASRPKKTARYCRHVSGRRANGIWSARFDFAPNRASQCRAPNLHRLGSEYACRTIRCFSHAALAAGERSYHHQLRCRRSARSEKPLSLSAYMAHWGVKS